MGDPNVGLTEVLVTEAFERQLAGLDVRFAAELKTLQAADAPDTKGFTRKGGRLVTHQFLEAPAMSTVLSVKPLLRPAMPPFVKPEPAACALIY